MATPEGKENETFNGTCHVTLGNNPLSFDTSHSSMYFDRCNRQIVTAHDKEVRRFSLRRERDQVKISHIGLSFVLDTTIIKFSLDHKFLTLLKSHQQVDFINLETQVLLSQRCKRQTSQILDFFWTGLESFFFVTTQGFELYQFSSKKTATKLVKEMKIPVKWYCYSSKLLVLGTGPAQNNIVAFFFKNSSIIRIPKFELDISNPRANNKLVVQKKQISICRLYDRVYCIHHQMYKKQLHLYQMNKEAISKSYVIDVPEGTNQIQVVDNILLCHNLQKQITLIFDIREDDILISSPLPLGISKNLSEHTIPYGEEWKYFLPNFVIIPGAGFLCEVKVNLQQISSGFTSKSSLIKFLLRRNNSKELILFQMQQLVKEQTSLAVVSRIFKHLNLILQSNQDLETFDATKFSKHNHQFLSSTILSPTPTETSGSVRNVKRDSCIVITQSDMHKEVFIPMDTEETNQGYFVSILVEYIRSLNHFQIDVLYFLYEMIINCLVRNNRFYQLHQFLQYHVIADSAPVAYQLLSIEQRYPPAGQLALDMLKRLRTEPSHIIEILLLRKRVLPALRVFKKSRKEPTTEEVNQFLEAAASLDDEILFYTVFKYFLDRRCVEQTSPHTEQFNKICKK